jgi:hypothetical protein
MLARMQPKLRLAVLTTGVLCLVALLGGRSAAAGRAAVVARSASPTALSARPTDIPDNQVFLTFRNGSAGYSIKSPEGWQQQGRGNDLTFKNRSNFLRVVVSSGPAFTLASVRADIARLKAATPSVKAGSPTRVHPGPNSAIKVVYTVLSTPDPVTGKRVTLAVDRYYLSHGKKRAVVDLAGVQGDDNVDSYRLIIESFRWH